MKLRIQNNSVRIRVNDQEVEKLAAGKSIAEQTMFPATTITYKVAIAANNSADFIDNILLITLNEDVVKQWASTDQIGISITVNVQNDQKLSIFVEKDIKI